MYGGVGLFAEALGVTEKELFKMMESGQLMSAEVMPKLTKRMQEFVRENDALAKSMQTVNAQQGRFQTALTGGKEALFKGGMGEGMAYFFKTSAQFLNDAAPLMKWFGALTKGVIVALTALAKVIVLPLNLLADFAKMFNFGGDLSAIAGGAGVLAAIAVRFNLIKWAIFGANLQLLTMIGRLAAIIIPLLLLEDIYVSMKGGMSVTGVNLSAKEAPWYSRYGIYNADYKKENGEIGIKFFFDSEEMKKFVRVEQLKGNKYDYAGLAAELN